MKVSIKDASRQFLEIMAVSLARDIDNGAEDKREILEQVFDQIPRAPEYFIDDRRRG